MLIHSIYATFLWRFVLIYSLLYTLYQLSLQLIKVIKTHDPASIKGQFIWSLFALAVNAAVLAYVQWGMEFDVI